MIFDWEHGVMFRILSAAQGLIQHWLWSRCWMTDAHISSSRSIPHVSDWLTAVIIIIFQWNDHTVFIQSLHVGWRVSDGWRFVSAGDTAVSLASITDSGQMSERWGNTNSTEYILVSLELLDIVLLIWFISYPKYIPIICISHLFIHISGA